MNCKLSFAPVNALQKFRKQFLLFAFFLSSLLSVEAKLLAKYSRSGAALIAKWRTEKFVCDLNFSPAAQRLVWIGSEQSKSSDGLVYSIHCSNYRTGKKVWDLRLRHEGSDLAFSPDGKTLAYSGGDEHRENGTTLIRLLDAATGHLKHTVAAVAPYGITGGLKFSPDGKTLAYGSFNEKGNEINRRKNGTPYDMAIVCLDAKTRKPMRALHGLRWGHVTDIAFSPDGRLVAATTFAGDAGVGELAIWRRTGKLLHHEEDGDWDGVDFLSNRRLMVGSALVLTYNGRRFTSRRFPDKSTEPVFISAVSHHAAVALSSKEGGYERYTFQAWQVRPRQKILALALLGYDFQYMVSSHNVFALSYNGEIKVWRLRKNVR